MKLHDVEHYIVRPKSTVGDWIYEYSDGSNVKDDVALSEDMINTITSIVGQNVTQRIQDVVSTINTLTLNITTVTYSINNHINDTTVHVTAEDKARWDSASSNNNCWTISVSNKTLYLSK